MFGMHTEAVVESVCRSRVEADKGRDPLGAPTGADASCTVKDPVVVPCA